VGLVGSGCETFAFEVISSEGWIEVDILLIDFLSSNLLHDCDIIDNRKEHVFDIVSTEG
jgi:hypothetical protein